FWLGLAYILGGLALMTGWWFLFWPEAGFFRGAWDSARKIIAIILLPFGLGGVFVGLWMFWLSPLTRLLSRRRQPPGQNEG
ncbi:MAG: hypothetical protein Q8O40_09970, partial [Chloroflexota bacterium]|nr:hypothetical protein [Chloroflexota bacterium]